MSDSPLDLGPVSLASVPTGGVPTRLFGLVAGLDGADEGSPHACGPAILISGSRVFEAGDFVATDSIPEPNGVTIRYRIRKTGCVLEVRWWFDPATGVVCRRDRIQNLGDQPFAFRRFHSRLTLNRDRYELYTQRGTWAAESQGRWLPLHAGAILLGCEGGRTTQYSAPILGVRGSDGRSGLVLHLVPCGNWAIQVHARPIAGGEAQCVIEAGIAADALDEVLPPGHGYEGPPLILAEIESGQIERTSARLHDYLTRTSFQDAKKCAPVIFNTWLDLFDHLDRDRLRRQLPVLRELGVDVLEIDAGWYGRGGIGEWHDYVGDWSENPDRSFFGEMQAFADEVRASGLGFGLFMEPETVGASAPVRNLHPDWFLGGGGRLDLCRPEVFEYVKGEILRLIERYGLAWIRLDLNSHLGWDETGTELRSYFEALYRLFDEVRSLHPETFVEQCASGGMRYDLSTLQRGDAFYLTDTQNPVDMIRISEGTLLRVLPGRSSRMFAMRTLGNAFPAYPVDPNAMPDTLVTTPATGWQPAQYPEAYDLDFVALVTMLGVMGISGDPASLSPRNRRRLADHISFYKQLQPEIMGASATLLTEARPVSDRSGWSVFQYHLPDDEALVFAFRLQDARSLLRLRLVGLSDASDYRVTTYPDGEEARVVKGRDLMNEGLEIRLPKPASASLIQARRVRSGGNG